MGFVAYEGLNMMLCKSLEKSDLKLFLAATGEYWVSEIKEDGDRVQMFLKDGTVHLINRRGVEVSEKYPEFEQVDLDDTVLDGEMCVIGDTGISLFNEGISFRSHCSHSSSIRQAMNEYPVTFVAFDILRIAGKNIKDQPYWLRRTLLEKLELDLVHPNLKIVEQSKDIMKLWDNITGLGGEGIILKHINSVYQDNKRSPNWRKVKDIKEADLKFVSFEDHNRGITVTSDKGIRVTVNGNQSTEVKTKIQNNGFCMGTIRHLGQGESGKFRQPTWMKVI